MCRLSTAVHVVPTYSEQTGTHVIACSGPVTAVAWTVEIVMHASAALAVTGGNAFLMHKEVHACMVYKHPVAMYVKTFSQSTVKQCTHSLCGETA